MTKPKARTKIPVVTHIILSSTQMIYALEHIDILQSTLRFHMDHLKYLAAANNIPFDISGVITTGYHQKEQKFRTDHSRERYVIVMTYHVPEKLLNLKAFW